MRLHIITADVGGSISLELWCWLMFIDSFGKFFQRQGKSRADPLRLVTRLDRYGRDLIVNVWLAEDAIADALQF
jgi:hypothetical protein